MRRRRMSQEYFHELILQEALKRVLELARVATRKRDNVTLNELKRALENYDSVAK